MVDNTAALLAELKTLNRTVASGGSAMTVRGRGAADDQEKSLVLTRKQANQALQKLQQEYRSGRMDLQTYHKSLRDLRGSTRKQIEVSANAGKAISALGLAAKEALSVTRASLRTGIQATSAQIIQSRMMGMSQVELIETMGQYRQTIDASSGSADDFNKRLSDASSSLFAWTGSLKAGAIFQAETEKAFRDLGGGTVAELEHFTKKQTDMMKRAHDQFSITTDEYASMNRELIASSSVREQLFKMDVKKRQNYVLELQQQRDLFRANGMTIEQAKRAAETLAEIGGMGGKSRIKQAAKLQAAMGGFGVDGGSAARAADLYRGGLRDPESQAEFSKLMGPLMDNINKMQSSGLAGEVTADALIEKGGLGPLIASFKEMNLGRGNAIAPGNKIPEGDRQASILTKILFAVEHFSSWMQNSFIGALTAGITGTAVLSKLLNGGGSFKNLGKKGADILGKIGKTGSALLGGAAAIGGKALGGIQAAGSAVGSVAAKSGSALLGGARAGASIAGKGLLAASPVGAVGAVGLTGYEAGGLVNNALESIAPNFHRSMQDTIGGAITSALSVADNTQEYWSKAIIDALKTKDSAGLDELIKQAMKTNEALEKGNKLTEQQTRIVEETAGDQVNETRTIAQIQRVQGRSIAIRSSGQRAGF